MFATEFLIPVILYTRTPNFLSPPGWNYILFKKTIEKQLNSTLICVSKTQCPFYSYESKNNLHPSEISKNLNSPISDRIKVVGHLIQHKSKNHFPVVNNVYLETMKWKFLPIRSILNAQKILVWILTATSSLLRFNGSYSFQF